MKITYRVPTRQYAYIEIEDEAKVEDGAAVGIIKRYFELEDEYRKQADAKMKAKENEAPFEDEGDVTCGIGKTRNEYLKTNKK